MTRTDATGLAAPLGLAGETRGSLGWRRALVLIFIVALAVFPGQTTIPVMDRDEARYTQAATQMMETGDFVDIRFQEQARHVKPAGIYWMQVAATAPFGGPDAPIWAFRLPSFLGVLIAALATGLVGARIGGPTAGLMAGALLSVCLACGVEGRTAKTDAMLLASAAVAQGALFHILTRPKDSAAPGFIGAPLIFWAASGLAIMIKGPIVAMVSAATIASYGLWTRDRSVLKRLRPLPGLALALLIGAPWLVLITIRSDGAFLQEAIGHALLGKVAESDDSHAGPIGYHTLFLPITFWPGTVLLALAIAGAWARRAEPAAKFLIAWIIPTWIIFELVATKLPHYVLPTFPAIAILAALGVLAAPDLRRSLAAKIGHGACGLLFVVVGGVVAVAPTLAAHFLSSDSSRLANLATAGMGALAILAGVALAARPRPNRVWMLIAAVAGLYWAAFFSAIPATSALWPSHRVALVVNELTGCPEILAATAGYREPSNVKHLGTRTVLGDGGEAARHLSQNAACGLAVVDASEQAAFEREAARLRLGVREVGRVEGKNTVKDDDLKLRVLVNVESELERRAAQR